MGVLDAGGGTGCHSLVFQERGLSVCAIDACPQAVEIMVKRGVKEIHYPHIFEFTGGPFDTMRMRLHGIGIVETLSGLDHFLGHAHELLKPDGQRLFDSVDERRRDTHQHGKRTAVQFKSQPSSAPAKSVKRREGIWSRGNSDRNVREGEQERP